MRWERVPPPEPCISPDGHRSVDCMEMSSLVPVDVRCDRCGRSFQVVVFKEEAP